MDFAELTAVPADALPVARFRDHLRLGRGFADDGVQDAVLVACLRAALAVIEARTGKALFRRPFRLRLANWREPDGQGLPVAPVASVSDVRLVARDGSAAAVDPAQYRLVPDTHRPMLRPGAATLPLPPAGGGIEIDFEAGFGPDWTAIPADLAQAVLLLAAHYHDNRSATEPGAAAGLPYGIAALVERHRTVRILGAAP
jgi:uncharacterized phiE125 gp8 family phage protein